MNHTTNIYAITRQHCADIFTKGFANEEMWKVLMSMLFFPDPSEIARDRAQQSCVAMPSTDARIAMEIQQTADEQSGAKPHDMPQRNVGVSELCMFIGHVHHDIPPPFLPKEEDCSQDSPAKARAGGDSLQYYPWRSQGEGLNSSPTPSHSSWAGGDSLRHDHRREQKGEELLRNKRRDVVIAPMAWAGSDSGEQRGPRSW